MAGNGVVFLCLKTWGKLQTQGILLLPECGHPV